MIYVFIPYWHEDTPEFKKSLESQTFKKHIIIRRNRKASKILWTEAVNDFYKECKRWCGTKDDDVICIMNNDIEFDENLFDEVSKIKNYVWYSEGVAIDWKNKKFYIVPSVSLSFIGHCFAMTLGDFKKSGGFCKYLPHALADIDYGLKVTKKYGACLLDSYVYHKEHDYEPTSIWSWRSYENPIVWTIFLLKNPNRYTLLNILKAWYDAFR